MFGWLKKKDRPVRLAPESRWTVVIDGNLIRVRDDQGRIRFVGLGDLGAVVIETNDSGPIGMDVWWLLFGADEQLACAFPQGATGEAAMIDYLTALPAFDFGQMTQAMTSTANARFPVWRALERR